MAIPFKKFEEILHELSIQFEPQSAFQKVSLTSGSIYVAKSKDVRRVDISGDVTVEHPALVHIPAEVARQKKLGKVRAQLDFSQPDELVLEAFRAVIWNLSGQEMPLKAARGELIRERHAASRSAN